MLEAGSIDAGCFRPAGPRVRRLIEGICRDTELRLSDIVNVDYQPRNEYDLALVLSASPSDGALSRVEGNEYVSSFRSEGRFLNLKLTRQIAAISEASSLPKNKEISVEHTSLVPVYPINLSSFRSSVIGEWIRRALIYLGYSAKGRFWI